MVHLDQGDAWIPLVGTPGHWGPHHLYGMGFGRGIPLWELSCGLILSPSPPPQLYLAIALIAVVVVTGCFGYYQEFKSTNIIASFKNLVPQVRGAYPRPEPLRHAIGPRPSSHGVPVSTTASHSDPGRGQAADQRQRAGGWGPGGDQRRGPSARRHPHHLGPGLQGGRGHRGQTEGKWAPGGLGYPGLSHVFPPPPSQVDNSSLTGESEPQTRSPECTHDSPLETRNIAFFSTMCLEGGPDASRAPRVPAGPHPDTQASPAGTATGLVINTGDRTIIGRIASLASGVENEKTPIAIEIEHFVDIIAGLAIFFGATFFVVAMVIGYPFLRAMVFFMAIVVAYVPEGLLATVTVWLGALWEGL